MTPVGVRGRGADRRLSRHLFVLSTRRKAIYSSGSGMREQRRFARTAVHAMRRSLPQQQQPRDDALLRAPQRLPVTLTLLLSARLPFGCRFYYFARASSTSRGFPVAGFKNMSTKTCATLAMWPQFRRSPLRPSSDPPRYSYKLKWP